jgi:hypothetical protein
MAGLGRDGECWSGMPAESCGPRYLPRYPVPSLNGRILTNALLIIITNEKVVVLQEFSDRWFFIQQFC